MADLGTSVISHKGSIVQGAEHPEYQVEDLLQAGRDNFDVTTADSPDAAQHLPGQGWWSLTIHHPRAEELSVTS